MTSSSSTTIEETLQKTLQTVSASEYTYLSLPKLLSCFVYQAITGYRHQNTSSSYVPFSSTCSTYFPHPLPGPTQPLLSPKEYFLSRGDDGSWFEYLFETDNTELGRLTTPTAFVVLICLVLWLRMFKAWFKPKMCRMGKKYAIGRYGQDWVKKKEHAERIVKFGEYCFRLLFHSSVAIYGLYFFSGKPWWDIFSSNKETGTVLIWHNFPNQTIEPAMQWFYLIQAAYNVEEFIFLTTLSLRLKFDFRPKAFPFFVKIGFSENIRGDFREMATHHLVTNILIFGSSHCHFFIVGSMIFMVHDISDIPVDMSKLANFMKLKSMTVVFFVLLLLFWLIFRLVILPFVIVRSVMYESSLGLVGGATLEQYHVVTSMFLVPLFILVFLHLFWFFILVKIALVLVRKGETHDLSEHKAGEKQD